MKNASLESDNPLRFRNNRLERISKLIMSCDDKVKDGKLQQDIRSETVKISALLLTLHESFTGEEILLSDQSRMVKQAIFTYCSLGKALENQTKTNVDQRKKQLEA